MLPLKDLLAEILLHWPDVSAQPFKGHDFAVRFRHEYPAHLMSHLDNPLKHLAVHPHIGHNTWGEVPYLAIIDKRLTKSVKHKFFVAY
ncbi:MAG: DUF3578 domain-containing protein, partial [Algicola sp.]|nr:DUF3578 domain-containing protein [Algicola sp.]